MPRNGQGVWSPPSGTSAVSNELISSADFNSLIADIGADLNLPRPITAGGTGSTNAADSRTELGVDRALSYTTKGANYTALAADKNVVMRFTAAATLSLTAASTLGSGWHLTVIADGGAVVIDPNGSETINGASSIVLAQDTATRIVCDGSAFFTDSRATTGDAVNAAAIHNYLSGFTLSNNSTDANFDIDITAGSCTDSTNTHVITLTSGLTKQLDALWAAGTNQGGRDTGSVANATYHVFAIKNPSTGVVDVLFSQSVTSPTLPSGFTAFRRIGSIIYRGAKIVGFTQFGDEFLQVMPVHDISRTLGTSAVLEDLDVPVGIKVFARLRLQGSASSNWGILVSSPDAPDVAPDPLDAPLITIGNNGGSGARGEIIVRTNTSSQVRCRGTTTNITFNAVCYGWIDTRGK